MQGAESVFTYPNLLTLARLGLTPLFVIAVLNNEWSVANVIFICAILTDVLDGILARGWNQRTQLGAYLDPIADKFLVSLSLIVLFYKSMLPLWLLAVVIGRDFLIVVGVVLYLALMGRWLLIRPTVLGKFTTLLQFILIFCLIMHANGYLGSEHLWLIEYAAGATTVVAFLHYSFIWLREVKVCQLQ